MKLPTRPCRYCKRPISLIRTPKGHLMPVDPEPDETGNLLVGYENGVLLARVARDDLEGVRMMPHWASCPARARKPAGNNGNKS